MRTATSIGRIRRRVRARGRAGAAAGLALLACWGGAALAGPRGPGAPPRWGPSHRLITPAGVLRLAPVLPAELIGSGGDLAVDLLGGSLPAVLAAPGIVTRQVPTLWEASVPAGLPLERIRVDYELVGPGGLRERIAPAGAALDGIAVRLRTISPVVVRVTGNRAIVRGGAVLELASDTLRYAGRYEGSLTVTVSWF